ncbi:hypothetical protein Tco_0179593 [Tanacetum coccineum]
MLEVGAEVEEDDRSRPRFLSGNNYQKKKRILEDLLLEIALKMETQYERVGGDIGSKRYDVFESENKYFSSEGDGWDIVPVL